MQIILQSYSLGCKIGSVSVRSEGCSKLISLGVRSSEEKLGLTGLDLLGLCGSSPHNFRSWLVSSSSLTASSLELDLEGSNLSLSNLDFLFIEINNLESLSQATVRLMELNWSLVAISSSLDIKVLSLLIGEEFTVESDSLSPLGISGLHGSTVVSSLKSE